MLIYDFNECHRIEGNDILFLFFVSDCKFKAIIKSFIKKIVDLVHFVWDHFYGHMGYTSCSATITIIFVVVIVVVFSSNYILVLETKTNNIINNTSLKK